MLLFIVQYNNNILDIVSFYNVLLFVMYMCLCA